MGIVGFAGMLVVGCAVLGAPAHAQSASASGPGALRRLAGACKAETARFCPALQADVPRPRDQLICLRPYRTSLSLGCRGAVNALTVR